MAHMASVAGNLKQKVGYMALDRQEPKQKGGDIWLQVLLNQGRRVLYGFGSHPRPKAFTFWPRPNMLRFWNRCRT